MKRKVVMQNRGLPTILKADANYRSGSEAIIRRMD